MKIFKLSLAICILAFCMSFISVRAQDNPAQAAARAALMEKLNALEVQPALSTPETKPMPATEAVQTTAAPSDAEPQAKARSAVEQKMSELDQKNWATPEVMSPTNQINANYPGNELGLKPIEAPPLPISAAKQAQLGALLAKYMANAITPGQYQIERAKILANP